MFKQDFQANKQEPKDRVQLVDLVSWGQRAAVEELIQKAGSNLDINEKDANGNFAAIIAAERNDLRMLTLLVKHGARLDLEDGRGRTVLGWAKKNENNRMIEFINQNFRANTFENSLSNIK